MDISTFFAIAGVNVALMGWLRNDMRGFQADTKAELQNVRRDIRDDVQIFQSEMRGWKEEMQKESKDFHGRLCAIEERQKKSEKK